MNIIAVVGVLVTAVATVMVTLLLLLFGVCCSFFAGVYACVCTCARLF